METVVVALVVGAFGGFAGAAAGPFLGHIFNAWERRDIRRERRHADMRLMLESRVANVRGLNADHFGFIARIKTIGQDPRTVYLDYVQRPPRDGETVLWQPERIDDQTLRSIAVELNDAAHVYRTWFTEVVSTPFPAWDEEATKRSDAANDLARRGLARLDDLDW